MLHWRSARGMIQLDLAIQARLLDPAGFDFIRNRVELGRAGRPARPR